MLLLSLLLALPVSAAFNPAVDAIYNGKAVAAGGSTWKYSAAISIQIGTGEYWNNCTAVFVESDLLLTAAHCLEGSTSKSQMYIRLFKQNDPKQVTWITPDPGKFRLVPHPNYSKYRQGDDIAIIVFKDQEIPDDFGTAQLQTTEQDSASDTGQPAIVVGAGTTANGKLSDRLLFANGTISNYVAGGQMQITFGGFFQNVTQQGACGGDSGGPVFVSVGKQLYLTALNTAIQADLTSDCGSTLNTTSIDAARYNWILDAAGEARDALSKTAE